MKQSILQAKYKWAACLGVTVGVISGCSRETETRDSSFVTSSDSVTSITEIPDSSEESDSSIPITQSSSRYYMPLSPSFSPDGKWISCIQSIEAEDKTDNAETVQQPKGSPLHILFFEAASGKRVGRRVSDGSTARYVRWLNPYRLLSWRDTAMVWKVQNGGKTTQIAEFDLPDDLPAQAGDSKRINTPQSNKPQTKPIRATYTQAFADVDARNQSGARLLSRNRVGTEEYDWLIEIFSTKTDKRLRYIQPKELSPSNGKSLQFSPQGPERLLTSEHYRDIERQETLWNPRTGQRLWQRKLQGYNMQMDWTPDGRFLIASQVSGSLGRDIHPLHDTLVLDAVTGRTLRKLPTQFSYSAVAVGKDVLASFGVERQKLRNSKDRTITVRTVHIINWKTGKLLQRAEMTNGDVQEVAMSPNGQLFVGCTHEGLFQWKLSDIKLGKAISKQIYVDEEEYEMERQMEMEE